MLLQIYENMFIQSISFRFNRKEQVFFLSNLELTHSRLISKNEPTKCNHCNCILFVGDVLNCSNVSEYKILFGLPNEIQTCLVIKNIAKIFLIFLKILICIDIVSYLLNSNIRCIILIELLLLKNC